MVVKTWWCNFVAVVFVSLNFVISFHALLFVTFHVMGPWGICTSDFSETVSFSKALANLLSSGTYFFNCLQYSCFFDTLFDCKPKCAWSRNDVGSSTSTCFMKIYHVGLMFCFLTASCTQIRKVPQLVWQKIPNYTFFASVFQSNFLKLSFHNGPARGWPYRFLSRRTTGSSIMDHDFGHLCLGRRYQNIWTYWLWNLNTRDETQSRWRLRKSTNAY